ncbi:MAG: hypothetical protein KDC38_09185 [Planctomycetes bacterium]|nr:hypothetical protein [Planctomycetota bacterium]
MLRRIAPLIALFGLTAALLAPSTASAQITGTIEFEVVPTSSYFDDCDPGTLCLVVFCGLFEGTMTFEYTGFDGTYDNYDVSVDWPVHISFCPADGTSPATLMTGTGLFQIDREPIPSQRLMVDLVRPVGPMITIDSGWVIPTVAFPAFSMLELVSVPTAETFTLTADPLQGPQFSRGDANGDSGFDISDAVFTLSSLFVPGSVPLPCRDAADSNDDGGIDIADAVAALHRLFSGGAPLPSPSDISTGPDPTTDGLGCL